MFKNNNKGSISMSWETVIYSALGIILLIIGSYFIINNLWKGTGEDIQQLNQCSSPLTQGKGYCKTSCEDGELAFGKLGCEENQKCCIPTTSEGRDAILPDGYGGSSEINFEVTGIKATAPAGCTMTGNEIKCAPDKEYIIPISVEIINTKGEVEIFADPISALNDELSEMSKPGDHADVTKITILKDPAQKGIAYANVKIPSEDSQKGFSVHIYPYAKCASNACIEASPNGIYSGNQNQKIIVNFE